MRCTGALRSANASRNFPNVEASSWLGAVLDLFRSNLAEGRSQPPELRPIGLYRDFEYVGHNLQHKAVSHYGVHTRNGAWRIACTWAIYTTRLHMDKLVIFIALKAA
jgi:hypothetical protein